MADSLKPNKRWFLKAEILVLLFLLGVLAARSGTSGIARVTAGVLKQVVKVKPDSAAAHVALGDAYSKSGNYEKAIEAYYQAVAINPGFAEAYNGRGYAFIQHNAWHGLAIRDYSKAIELNPQYAQAYYNRGIAYCQVGQYDKGREDVQKAQGLGYQPHTKRFNGPAVKLTTKKTIAAPNRTSIERKKQQQLNDLDMRLNDLDRKLRHVYEYVPQQRQKVENWYASELARLEQWKKTRLEQLNREEELARAQCYQDIQNTTSETVGYQIQQGRSVGNTFIISDGRGIANAYSNTYTTKGGLSLDKERTSVVGDPAGRYEAELHRIKMAKEAIELEFVKLERRRDRYLAEINREASNAITQMNNARTQIPAAKRSVQKSAEIRLKGGPGLIGAVSVSGDGNRLVWVEDRMLRQGDWINGFKVTGIYSDRVEFDKSGETWVYELK